MCEINFWAIVIGVVASIILAMVWYSPKVFGNIWMRETKIVPNEEDKKTMWKKLIAQAFATFVMIYVFARLSILVGCNSVSEVVALGISVWIGFFLTSGVSLVLWEKKTLKGLLISSGYDLAVLIMVALILSLFK